MDSGIVLAAFGCWVLAAFVGGELLIDLLSFSSFWLSLVYAMMILNLSMQITGTPGGVEREHVKLLYNFNCSSYPLIIDIT